MPPRQKLRDTPEFTPFLLVATLQVAAATVSSLALATLVYAATASPFLAALSMFGASLTQVAGAVLLMSAADRLPPRAATAALALFFAVGTAVLAVPGLPLGAVFAVLLCQGLAASVGGGVRYGLLGEILPREHYVLGRSVLGMGAGTVQICGFAVGGVLVGAVSPRGTLLGAAGLYATAAAVALTGLRRRKPRAVGRASIGETRRVNSLLWSSRSRRLLYLALWVPNGLIVGCESLFVPYAPGHAGQLFAASALGMLAGDTVAGRFLSVRLRRLLPVPLLLLLAAPYPLLALRPPLPVAVVALFIGSLGYAAGLLQQERLVGLVPVDVMGQALGLHSSGMLACQGVGAALAGAVAQGRSAGAGMAVMAVASVAVTLGLAVESGRIRRSRRGVERQLPAPQQASGG
ncbi:MFS transporter [Streptomyces sp. NBC_00083]|uniref:MFS transporter n=1 Tax=Streptomyces sp. NBC_00083 TaxID=2975647 RepID=UPI0022566645|nr:MFS transporter [Streptomyces sp. NBC_00083]MCX5386964.1 MFS transporter [Streptomyces sp. NBC_00083]